MINNVSSRLIASIILSVAVFSCKVDSGSEPDYIVGVDNVLTIISGNNQQGELNTRLRDSIVVCITKKEGTPVRGAKLAFSVIAGGGSTSNQTVKTNSAGKASITWTLGNGPEQILKITPDYPVEINPVYIFANSHLEIDTKWITGLNYYYYYNDKYEHDNRILETNNFLVFSDGATDDAKIKFAKMAEESFYELKQAFNITSNAEINFSPQNTSGKIKLFSIKEGNHDQSAFPYGFILYGIGSLSYQRWQFDDFRFRKEIKHESTHVLQFLLGVLPTYGVMPVWFEEGIAEYASGGAIGTILNITQWNAWISIADHINPIKIHRFSNYPVPYERIGEYYPAYWLAINYLLDRKGLGKTLNDFKLMIVELKTTRNFDTAFQKYMGISTSYFEEHFIELITEFLRNQ